MKTEYAIEYHREILDKLDPREVAYELVPMPYYHAGSRQADYVTGG